LVVEAMRGLDPSTEHPLELIFAKTEAMLSGFERAEEQERARALAWLGVDEANISRALEVLKLNDLAYEGASGRWGLTRRGEEARVDASASRQYVERAQRLEAPGLDEASRDGVGREDAAWRAEQRARLIRERKRWYQTSPAVNEILFGPPGTGKTYEAVRRAVELVEGQAWGGDRASLQARYDELLGEGYIELVTFHQSYGYEDFVEGMRPVTRSGAVSYEVRDGALKELAWRAIRGMRPMTSRERELWPRLIQYLPVWQGAEVKISDDALEMRASQERSLTLSRELVERLSRGWLTLSSVGRAVQEIGGEMALCEEMTRLLREARGSQEQPSAQYVLIIDEINRGNISRVLGELITLLEPNKRLGAAEGMSARLPVSGELFALPANLHILGTMNTADRSIALLDMALRRRFKFREMMPDEHKAPRGRPRAVMAALNKRITALLGREHQLGHALFMGVSDEGALRDVILEGVLPLLQEYFYGDWVRIAAVLGCERGYGEGAILRREPLRSHGLSTELIEEEDAVFWRVDEAFRREAGEALRPYLDRLIHGSSKGK
jgi:hypothetical protein